MEDVRERPPADLRRRDERCGLVNLRQGKNDPVHTDLDSLVEAERVEANGQGRREMNDSGEPASSCHTGHVP